MTLHRLVHIQRVNGWCIETGQPHVANDHQLQRIVRIFEALFQQLALLLVGAMRLEVRRVGRRSGHHYLYVSGIDVVRMPLRLQLDDLVI
ncbi:hypothetical protein D3C71_1742400 [compost metagenome]